MAFEIIHFDSVTSTMDAAVAHYKKGALPPFAIVADEQTNGRGRRGRTWMSMRGNLFVTYVITCPKRMVPYMSFVAAISVHETLTHYKKINKKGRHQKNNTFLTLKWPNDVLLNEKKVAGILIDVIEDRDDYTALGIGVGLNTHHAPENVLYPTTCLVKENYQNGTNDALMMLNGERLEYNIRMLKSHGWEFIKLRWLAQRHGGDSPVSILQGDTIVKGTFDTLDDVGRLVLMLEDGSTKSFATGDVFF